jgi:hypothetical protein
LAITKIIKFKNGATVSFDDEFMQKGVTKIETAKWIITKTERDYSQNPNIKEVIYIK